VRHDWFSYSNVKSPASLTPQQAAREQCTCCSATGGHAASLWRTTALVSCVLHHWMHTCASKVPAAAAQAAHRGCCWACVHNPPLQPSNSHTVPGSSTGAVPQANASVLRRHSNNATSQSCTGSACYCLGSCMHCPKGALYNGNQTTLNSRTISTRNVWQGPLHAHRQHHEQVSHSSPTTVGRYP
jgi:hypothetical protein